MDISDWLRVQREDGETVGYLESLDPAFERFQPRSVLGHVVGAPCAYVEGEDRLLTRGLSELMDLWTLDGAPVGREDGLSILEVSPEGIEVAHALRAKAGIPTPRIRVAWPDAAERLARMG